MLFPETAHKSNLSIYSHAGFEIQNFLTLKRTG